MKNNVEQADNSVSKIGKFNNADDLLAAYNALESEFTKRCQLIKQLQAELEKYATAQASEQSEAQPEASLYTGDEPVPCEQNPTVTAQPDKEQTAEREHVSERERESERQPKTVTVEPAVASTADVDFDTLAAAVVGEVARNAAAYAEMLCALPEVMDACVAKYKQRLIETRFGPSPSGVAVIAPVARPRTLADAKILADRLLRA